jgi:hypothetical protein
VILAHGRPVYLASVRLAGAPTDAVRAMSMEADSPLDDSVSRSLSGTGEPQGP